MGEAKRGRVELGCAGHFVAASGCMYRRHTQVGNYRISSVGDYYPVGADRREQIGAGRYFETMVFRTTDAPDAGNEGCGCRAIEDWSEIDGDAYQTAGEAQAGHEAMVEKYEAIAAGIPDPSSYRAAVDALREAAEPLADLSVRLQDALAALARLESGEGEE